MIGLGSDKKQKQIQVAIIRRFPGFYASGWLLKLQAELERIAKVRNIMLKSKWNLLDLSKFHPPNIVKSQICVKCLGNREQLGINTSSPLFPCCQPFGGIPAKVLRLIPQYFRTFILKIGLPCEDWRAFQHCLWPRLGPRLPQVRPSLSLGIFGWRKCQNDC